MNAKRNCCLSCPGKAVSLGLVAVVCFLLLLLAVPGTSRADNLFMTNAGSNKWGIL
jgi:hypothetical protein